MSSKKKQAELREEKDWKRIDEAVVGSGRFVEKYQKQLLTGITVIVVVVCGFLAYNHFIVGPKAKEAQAAMFRGEQYFRAGEDSLAVYGDGNGYAGFESIINDYGSTKPGKLAKLYAGICHANMGEYEKGLEYLKGYSGNDKILFHLANGTIGDCLDNLGKPEEAAPYYIKAAKGVDNESQSPVLYKKAALIYRDLGQYDKMIEIFTTIKNQYMRNTQAFKEADKYIGEATVMKNRK
jgi:tetratricopeptide (TPR) repeat protein